MSLRYFQWAFFFAFASCIIFSSLLLNTLDSVLCVDKLSSGSTLHLSLVLELYVYLYHSISVDFHLWMLERSLCKML